MKKNLPLVIIGSGGAAVEAVKAIRKNGCRKEVHLFTDSIQPPFNPMLLTYYLGEKIPLEKCFFPDNGSGFFAEHEIVVHQGNPVTEIDVANRTITDGKGKKTDYESCLIASGASPIIPPIPGSQSSRVFTIRSIEDAIRLRELIKNKPQKVLLIGASMVGIKLVEIFHGLGSEVYLVDLAPHIFVQATHPEIASMMEKELEKKGINLLLNSKVEAIEEGKEGLKVNLSGSISEVDADLLVFCIGVKPNMSFLRPGGVEIDRGILVDDRMCTSAPEIFAAGDVVQGLNLSNKQKEIIALWANACQQGKTAGTNMAGGNMLYPGSIPQNITHFFDVFLVSIGEIHHYDEIEKTLGHNSCSFIFKVQGRVIGINMLTIGNYEIINTAGIIRSQIVKSLHYPNYNNPDKFTESGFMVDFFKNGGI